MERHGEGPDVKWRRGGGDWSNEDMDMDMVMVTDDVGDKVVTVVELNDER